MSVDQLQQAWRDAKVADMLIICKDIASGELPEFQMPKHIQEVLDFLKNQLIWKSSR